MKTLKETIEIAIAKIIKIQIGKSFSREDSLRVLGAVQQVNRKYSNRTQGKSPLFIKENRVMFSEGYFV